MPYCPDCGAEVAEGDRHCAQCGAPLLTEERAGDTTQGYDRQPGVDHPDQSGDDTAEDPSRRRYLKWIGGGLVATGLVTGGLFGLSALGGPNHSHARDPWRNADRSRGQYRQRLTAEAVLPAGRYGVRTADVQGSVYVTIAATAATPFDVLTMTADAFKETYEDASGTIQFQTQLSAMGTTDFKAVALVPDDDYRIVFDNTRAYGAAPDGEVTIDFELQVSSPAPSFFDFRATLEEQALAYDRVGITSTRAFWGVQYSRTLTDQEQRTVITESLRAYAAHVPEPDGRHRGLRIGNSPFQQAGTYVTVPPDVARQFRDDRITLDEYIRRVIGENI